MKRYVTQDEKDMRREKVMKTPAPMSSNHTPFNDYPLVHYKQALTILSKTCTVTNERIPGFTKAWIKVSDYLIRDSIETEKEWVSDKGYVLLKLKGDV